MLRRSTQEGKEAARESSGGRPEAAVTEAEGGGKECGIEENLVYMDFPYDVIERLNHEIRRRTHAVGAFPDGSSALLLVCARLRHVAQAPLEA